MPVRQDSLINEELRERMRAARRVFVLTGAGVSAESGAPTSDACDVTLRGPAGEVLPRIEF